MSVYFATLRCGTEVAFAETPLEFVADRDAQKCLHEVSVTRSFELGSWLRVDHKLGRCAGRAAVKAAGMTWAELVAFLDSGPEHARTGGAS